MGHYGCWNPAGTLMYVGSSGLDIQRVEWNHRNYFRFKDGFASSFRKALTSEGSDWKFEWLQEPRDISRLQAEIEEGVLIRLLKPMYNQDKYPYETSVRHRRMEKV